MRLSTAAAFLLCSLAPGVALAAGETPDGSAGEDDGVSYGAQLDMASRYLDQGIAQGEHAVVQPSAHVGYHRATLTAWSNIFVGEEQDMANRLGELKLTAEYELPLGALTVTPGLTGRFAPEGPRTAELGAVVSYDLGALAIQTHPVVDVLDNAGGWYADLGVIRSQALGARLDLEGAASLAWCSNKFIHANVGEAMDGDHFGAAIVEVALAFAATPSVSVKLHGTFSRMLESAMRDAMAGDDNLIAFGLAVGVER
jgi:hypothetical protein